MTRHDIAAGETLLHWLRRRVAEKPDAIYLSHEGRDHSFAQIARAAESIAAHLHEVEVRPGDRVAAMLHNDPVSIAALLGIAMCGAVWVPVNVLQRGDGLRYQLEHCAPRALLAEPELIDVIRESGASLSDATLIARTPCADTGAVHALCLSQMFESDRGFDVVLPSPQDLFAISYTSGTTGRPKGVLVTYRMLELSATGALLTSQAQDGDVFFVWEPLYHIGGAQLVAVPLLRDIRLTMVPRFSASRFWQQVELSGATHIHYLGGIPQMLLNTAPSAHERSHRVRVAWGAGLPAKDWAPFEQRFGLRLNECYGMTEASSFTTCNLDRTPGAVGLPVPWLDFRICNAQGQALAAGEPGEIVVSERAAGALFAGYYRNPEATAKALRHGELWTGDLGKTDAEGRLYFLGRTVDSLRVRGENVSAWEIEHVVKGHPAIEDAAVIGVSAEIGEQEAKLFVQRKPGANLDAGELSAWLRPRLGKHQFPRYIAFVDSFQYTPSQRLMKHLLPRDVEGCTDTRAATSQGSEAFQ
ncbi:AMP-binding protein [Variovorax sp. PBL-E5]|uniref:AMP-binding protein n=1 Tax=Variovorax sp. PBL-E5 TaxID=434014 RepID=UPI001317E558|nr:AMP-binding protein [Variovorax sp. PBL-E5]VTU37793.1 Long-chain-fatty-acid--CoA ligase [Variovorax sp. PBL-E5]